MGNEINITKQIQDAMKEVPDGMLGIPFITPTDKDNFICTEVGERTFRVELDGNYAIAEIDEKRADGDRGFTMKQSEVKAGEKSDYYMGKLVGYIVFKLLK